MRTRTWSWCVVAGGLLASYPLGCGADDPSEFETSDGGTSSNGDAGGFTDFDSGSILSADGGESTDGNFADAACAQASATALRTPVYMLIVFDGSGSMDGLVNQGLNTVFAANSREVDPLNPTRPTENDARSGTGTPGLTGKKWLAARGALNAFWDQQAAVSPTDNSLGVGLYLFSSTDKKASTAVDVGIQAVNTAHATALKTRVNPKQAGANSIYGEGGTPLRPSIRDQGAILKAFTPAAPLLPNGKRVLVVITDGVPTEGGNAGETQTEVTTLRTGTPAVSTFVIGVGNPSDPTSVYDEVFLGDLAEAGGTAVPGCNTSWSESNTTGTPCHFQVTPGAKTATQLRDEFTAAINAIRDSVSSCEFPLEKPAGVGELDPGKVNVIYTSGGGQETALLQDPANGWSYDNAGAPTKVLLNGTACTTMKADPNGKIRIVVGCKTESKLN
jgi:hypothetical protein